MNQPLSLMRYFIVATLLLVALQLNATIHIITDSGFTFQPDNISITVGDTIRFNLSLGVDAVEVSFADYNTNNNTPLSGGFTIPPGPGFYDLTGLTLGTYYYVNPVNAANGMKGIINVLPPILPGSIRFLSTDFTVPEDTGTVFLHYRGTNPNNNFLTCRIKVEKSISTAEDSIDLFVKNYIIAIPPNVTDYDDSVEVSIVNDILVEDDEVAVFVLYNPSVAGSISQPDTLRLTIIDNDSLFVGFVGAAVSVREDSGEVFVRVAISSPFTDTTRVRVKRDAGSATPNVDFIFRDTTLVWLPFNADTQWLRVIILDDTLEELNEQINLSLEQLSPHAFYGISAFTIFIIDNDSVFSNTTLLQTLSVSAFPNPVQSLCRIISDDLINDIKVMDANGRLIHHRINVFEKEVELDFHDIPSGIYIAKIISGSRSSAVRIVK